MGTRSTLKVGGKSVQVSNLEKIFYPASGFTKGDLIDYYIKISEYILPHLKKRPLTLKRYPNGVDGLFFYEKQRPKGTPDWVKTTKVPRSDGTEIEYCMVNDLPSLVWAANLANLEFHTFLHVAPKIERPTSVAFDLDPGPPADIKACCKVGLLLRDIFESLGLRSFPKTSGSKGLQVYVPLNSPASNYEKTKTFAHAISTLLEERFPDLVVSRMQKQLRKGKVLIDWSQNDQHKTTVCVYSLRAKETPTVSAPVTWGEVEGALKSRSQKSFGFDTTQMLKRVAKSGDLFAPLLTLKQKLPTLNT